MITADAIIVAAGSGTRFGGPKQLVKLGGKPMYRHTVDTFASHPQIGRIVLVASHDVYATISAEMGQLYPNGRIEVVLGGSTRQRSVSNGMKKLSEGRNSEIVVIHDAARPGVDGSLITSVIAAAAETGASLAAIPVVDTIKREADGVAVETVSREHLWRAQTPQAVKFAILSRAIDASSTNGGEATDEAELVERIGVRAKIVLGSERNMKVTFVDDIPRIESLLFS